MAQTMAGDLARLDEAFARIDEDIARVEAEIQKVEGQIEAVERQIADARAQGDREEVAALRDEKGKLRDEKGKLRDKEGKLRDEKGKLRDEKGKLLDKEYQVRDAQIKLELETRRAAASEKKVVGLFYWPEVFRPVGTKEVPSTSALQEFLQGVLPNRGVPVSEELVIPSEYAESFYHRALHVIDSSLVAQLLEPEFTVTTGSENRRQLNWDRMFASLAEKVCTYDSRFELKRNAESSSLSGVLSKARPDFLVTVGGRGLFFGEEKMHVGQLGEAATELSEKLQWNEFTLGEKLPYVLGYAAAGLCVQLYALCANGKRHSISPVLNISVREHRFWLTRAVVNVMRLLPRLAELLPETATPIGQTLQRSEGVQITVTGVNVVKCVNASARHVDLRQLEKFYKEILPKVPRSIQCNVSKSSFSDQELKLWLHPVGHEVQEESRYDVAIVQNALRCVLQALAKLHDMGWCHRDVRWGNVLQTESEGYVLIDFEFAAPEGKEVTWKNRYLPPEVKKGCNVWGRAQDIYQAGQMLKEVVETGPELEVYLGMCKSNPAERWDARTILSHEFFEVRA